MSLNRSSVYWCMWKEGRQLFLRVAKPLFMQRGGNCDEDFCTLNSLIYWAKERVRDKRKLNSRGLFFPFLCPLPRELLQVYTQLHGQNTQLKLSLRIWTISFWFEFGFCMASQETFIISDPTNRNLKFEVWFGLKLNGQSCESMLFLSKLTRNKDSQAKV